MPRRGRGEYSAQSENRRYEVLPPALRATPLSEGGGSMGALRATPLPEGAHVCAFVIQRSSSKALPRKPK